jgi:FtsH-binding integral membrane protein
MSDYDYNSSARGTVAAEFDAGLRAYMLKVYNYMALGVGLTGVVSYMVAQSPTLLAAIFGTPLQWVVFLGPLGLVFFLSARINSLSSGTAQLLFWIYAASVGLMISSIFIAYQLGDITRVFFITTIMFGSLSLWGYTTKRSLSGMGTFMFMGLIGLIVAMIVNIFLQSAAMEFAISVIGVVIFAGLTAWDTQKIKQTYYKVAGDGEVAKKASIMGALRLYLDFLNMFLFLLRLFGGGRD